MKIRLERGSAGTFLLVAADSRDILIQSDWDFPGTASTFGWQACWCRATDGTVACAHRSQSAMIAEAWDYLTHHIGTTVDDPGYFSG